MSQPPRKLSPADLRKLRKVQTGPLLSSVAGKPDSATRDVPANAALTSCPATPALIGHFDRVRATLDRLRERE